MAKAIDFKEFTPSDSRDDLTRRVNEASAEHAEAILATYDLLERLHKKGVIDLLNGLLSADDTVVERVTDVISSRRAVTALRLGLILGDIITSIDPNKLHAVISAAEDNKPPSLMAIVKQATSTDARRGLAIVVGLLNLLGAALNPQHDKE